MRFRAPFVVAISTLERFANEVDRYQFAVAVGTLVLPMSDLFAQMTSMSRIAPYSRARPVSPTKWIVNRRNG